MDAEELRYVNISKKEFTKLVEELIEGYVAEGVSLESVELETPNKFMQNLYHNNCNANTNDSLHTPTLTCEQYSVTSGAKETPLSVARKIDFEALNYTKSETISSNNTSQIEYSFHPPSISTPLSAAPITKIHTKTNDTNQSYSNENVLNNTSDHTIVPTLQEAQSNETVIRIDYSKMDTPEMPIISNSKCAPFEEHNKRYVAIKKNFFSEYLESYESLKYIPPQKEQLSSEPTGFTPYQFQIFQQQLRIHVQFLTQNFIQTFCHPDLWKLAPKTKEMLQDLYDKSKENASFNAWNLKGAVQLVKEWEEELSEDNHENRDLMK